MFIYAVATAYSLHYAYLFTKSLTKTLLSFVRHTHRLGTALHITNAIAYIPIDALTQDKYTQTQPFDADIVSTPVENDDHDEYISVDGDIYSSSGSEYTLDTYEEDVIQEITEEEEAFIGSEKQNGALYLGHYFVSPDAHDAKYPLMMLFAIQPATFLKYSFYYVEKYMEQYLDSPRRLELMKTTIRTDGQYRITNVVLKTHWISLIQRHWKSVYSQRKYIVHKRMLPSNQIEYLLTGRYSSELASLPSLKGMLAHYA